jgi:hypothetical protein
MTKHEIVQDIISDWDGLILGSTKQFAEGLFENYIDWQPIELAKKTNFEPGLVILSNGQVPFYSCFWSEEKQGWMSRIQFNAADGQFKTVFNKVLNPTHFRALPPIP